MNTNTNMNMNMNMKFFGLRDYCVELTEQEMRYARRNFVGGLDIAGPNGEMGQIEVSGFVLENFMNIKI